MKNISISLLFVLISFYGLSQNRVEKIENGFSIEFKIGEEKYKDITNNFLTIRDFYEFTDASKSGEFKLPSKTFLVAIPKDAKPVFYLTDKNEEITKNVIPKIQPVAKAINDSVIIFEEVDYTDAKLNNLPQNDFELIGFTWYRENYCAIIKVYTYKFDVSSNQITRLKSFKLNVDLGSNFLFELKSKTEAQNNFVTDNTQLIANSAIVDQFASSQPLLLQDTTGSWIDYGSEYLKIGTAKDGLFRITRSDFEAMGIDVSSINPKTFRLFESGIEVPITVYGEEDNAFDSNDYIQFYGTLNYPKLSYRIINQPNEPYNEYLNRYCDTTFYFLTWGLQNGKRIVNQNVFNPGISDSLTYFKFFEHIESNVLYQNCYTDEVENQTPGWLRNKTWYFIQTVWFYSNTIRNYNFNVTDYVANKTAKFFYKAVSFGSNIISDAHQLILKINNALIDSQSINRNNQILLSGGINTNQFVANQNVLSVKNYANSSSVNVVVPDWYDIEYPRYLKLQNNFLLFTVPDDITNGLMTIKIQGAAAANYEIYKVKPYLKKIENYQIISNQLLFTDTVRIGDQYIVQTPNSIGDPVYYYK
ncbi:MAG TPA: hypothetical protein PK665_09095, partial [Ignavibacteriaceae bacterium]|nr:hypothetical protein [Ignavibacteriaceae bacterium]